MNIFLNFIFMLAISSLVSCGPAASSPSRTSGIGVSLPFPHDGNLARRNYTWTINRDYLPNLQEDYVHEQIQTAVSVWASVANLNFQYVSENADVTFQFHENTKRNPSLYPDAEAYCDTIADGNGDAIGARIYFNKASLKKEDSPVGAWKKGDYVDAWWYKPNVLLSTAIHEFGHFLGLHHSEYDSSYNPIPGTNESVMGQDFTTVNRPIFSSYDVEVIQKKYGESQYVPFIEIKRPNGRYFYTSSWNDANSLITSDPANVLTVLVGGLYRYPGPGRRALYRHYVPTLDGHSYSLDKPITAADHIQEGISGYVDSVQSENTMPMRLVTFGPHLEELFTTKIQNPEGTFDTASPAWGFITPLEKIGTF